MSLIQSGKTFNDGEQLTAAKLNQMFSDATLSTTGVDGTSIIVNTNDVLAVRSVNSARIDTGAVITDKLPDSTVTETDGTPDGVTFPKIQHIETDKILGRTTTGDGIVETIGLNTDDEMADASATTLATDGSIKAYVDSEITNNGITQTSGSAPYFGCRGFGSFNGKDSTPITPSDSGNVASIVRESAGTYKITFTETLPENYSALASAGHNPQVAYGNSVDIYILSSTSMRLVVAQDTTGPFNPTNVSFAVFG